jgi:hypothetical protein
MSKRSNVHLTNTVTFRVRAANAGFLEQLVLPGSKVNFGAHVVICADDLLEILWGTHERKRHRM